MQVDVRAADFGVHRAQQRRTGLEIRSGKLPDLERTVGAGHHARGVAHGVSRGT